jgi:hypothetical protein
MHGLANVTFIKKHFTFICNITECFKKRRTYQLVSWLPMSQRLAPKAMHMPVYGESLKMGWNERIRCEKAAVVINYHSTHFKLAIRWRWVIRFALRLLNFQRRHSLNLLHKRLSMLQKWYGRFGGEITPLNISPWRFVTKYKKERLIWRHFLPMFQYELLQERAALFYIQ